MEAIKYQVLTCVKPYTASIWYSPNIQEDVNVCNVLNKIEEYMKGYTFDLAFSQ